VQVELHPVQRLDLQEQIGQHAHDRTAGGRGQLSGQRQAGDVAVEGVGDLGLGRVTAGRGWR
jgi:hypothetical protein